MKKTIKILGVIILVAATLLLTVSCSVPTGKAKYDTSLTGEGTMIRMTKVKEQVDSYGIDDFVPSNKKSDFVLIKIKNYGDIVVALREDVAPITVKNFKKLVSEKFYDGTVFHRVMKDFMIQAGGYTSLGGQLYAKDSENIKGEFSDNGVVNNLTHVRGVIAMARISGMNDSASSQFYIVHETAENTRSLNGKYATFGYVLAGMDVVDAIANCAVAGDANSPRPIADVVIESITFVQPK